MKPLPSTDREGLSMIMRLAIAHFGVHILMLRRGNCYDNALVA